MNDLLTRLESAEAESRELSDEVLLALGWQLIKAGATIYTDDGGAVLSAPQSVDVFLPPTLEDMRLGNRPSPTENLQDAVDLVPEGWGYKVETDDWEASPVKSASELPYSVFASIHNIPRAKQANIERRSPQFDDKETKRGIYANTHYCARASSAPLAVCIAILRAREADNAT